MNKFQLHTLFVLWNVPTFKSHFLKHWCPKPHCSCMMVIVSFIIVCWRSPKYRLRSFYYHLFIVVNKRYKPSVFSKQSFYFSGSSSYVSISLYNFKVHFFHSFFNFLNTLFIFDYFLSISNFKSCTSPQSIFFQYHWNIFSNCSFNIFYFSPRNNHSFFLSCFTVHLKLSAL